MPRPRRLTPPGRVFHVVNRGNDRRTLYFQDADYERFIKLLDEGKKRASVKLFGFCVMPNHFHAVLQAEEEGAISAYLHWVTGRYACDFRTNTQTRGHGHVFQRRFWSRLIDGEVDLLTVMRYVEGNARRAELVPRAQTWRWSSLWSRCSGRCGILDDLPVELPDDWPTLVNQPIPSEVLRALRAAAKRGRPKKEPGPISGAE